MERYEHIRRLRETGSVIVPLIRTAYARLAELDPSIESTLSLMVSRRTNDDQPLLRPYLMRLGYEVSGGQNWHTIAAACAASEIFNISTYQANVAFDGKLMVDTQEQRAEQFACAMISLELAESVLSSMSYVTTLGPRILKDLQATNRELYLGQVMDLQCFKLLDTGPDTDFERLFTSYELRCRRLGGGLTRWCLETGARLACAEEPSISLLSRVGVLLGTAGQMVNDVGDLVPIPESGRMQTSLRYQVVFSDVRNGKLTFPILCALRDKDSEVQRLIEAIKYDPFCAPHILLTLTRRLVENGAFAETRKTLIHYLKEIRSLIRMLPPSEARDHLTLAATSVAYNKYFTALRLGSYGF